MPETHQLLTLSLPDDCPDPDLEAVAGLLGLKTDDLSPGFGVVPIDPQKRLYCVMVAQECIGKIPESARKMIEGPFADPKIAPFGPAG